MSVCLSQSFPKPELENSAPITSFLGELLSFSFGICLRNWVFDCLSGSLAGLRAQSSFRVPLTCLLKRVCDLVREIKLVSATRAVALPNDMSKVHLWMGPHHTFQGI